MNSAWACVDETMIYFRHEQTAVSYRTMSRYKSSIVVQESIDRRSILTILIYYAQTKNLRELTILLSRQVPLAVRSVLSKRTAACPTKVVPFSPGHDMVSTVPEFHDICVRGLKWHDLFFRFGGVFSCSPRNFRTWARLTPYGPLFPRK